MGATMVEGLDREVVEVSGTIRWASLVEALTGEVGEDVEGLVEIWEALEVIEVLEVDLEVEGVAVAVDKGLAVSRWIQTHSEEPLDLLTLIKLRRTRDQLKPHRCKHITSFTLTCFSGNNSERASWRYHWTWRSENPQNTFGKQGKLSRCIS